MLKYVRHRGEKLSRLGGTRRLVDAFDALLKFGDMRGARYHQQFQVVSNREFFRRTAANETLHLHGAEEDDIAALTRSPIRKQHQLETASALLSNLAVNVVAVVQRPDAQIFAERAGRKLNANVTARRINHREQGKLVREPI